MFSCEFCGILKKTFFTEHLRKTVSVNLKFHDSAVTSSYLFEVWLWKVLFTSFPFFCDKPYKFSWFIFWTNLRLNLNWHCLKRRKEVVLASLLLTLWAYFTLFSNVSIVDFEQINICWVAFSVQKLRLEIENTVRLMNVLNAILNTIFPFDIPRNTLHNTLSKTNSIAVMINEIAG